MKENAAKGSPLDSAVSRSHHECATTIALWLREHPPPGAKDENETSEDNDNEIDGKEQDDSHAEQA